LTLETYRLLKQTNLNFVGNIDGHDLFSNHSDVIVTDAFVGNAVLKACESTARLVARAINETKGSGTAQALDGRTVRVAAPTNPDDRINFLADLENLKVDLMAPSAKVVINARTGSIVMNQAVTLNACAIAHGNLAVTITSTPQVSQPGPLSNGQTTVTTKTDISIKQEPGVLIQLPASAKLADVVKALNSLGATPGDLVTILQAMKSAGALSAELEVI